MMMMFQPNPRGYTVFTALQTLIELAYTQVGGWWWQRWSWWWWWWWPTNSWWIIIMNKRYPHRWSEPHMKIGEKYVRILDFVKLRSSDHCCHHMICHLHCHLCHHQNCQPIHHPWWPSLDRNWRAALGRGPDTQHRRMQWDFWHSKVHPVSYKGFTMMADDFHRWWQMIKECNGFLWF